MSRSAAARVALPALVTLVLVGVLPLLATTPYSFTVFTGFCIDLLLLVGLNLISGYGGQLSLGQAGFYGAGAYAVTIGTVKLGLSPVVTLVAAPVVGAIFAVLVGIPSLRLRGLYFAMATLGVAVVFQLFLDRANHITGGPNGLPITDSTLLGLDLSDPKVTYTLAAALAVAGVLAAELFLRTSSGWGLRAAHASESAASVVGVNIFGDRLLALAICGAYAGLAGALFAFNTLYISPTSFSFFTSVTLFFVLAIGGLGTWSGPLIGALLLLVFAKWLTAFTDREPLILAVIFVISLRLFPAGAGKAFEPRLDSLLARLDRPSRQPASELAAADAGDPR